MQPQSSQIAITSVIVFFTSQPTMKDIIGIDKKREETIIQKIQAVPTVDEIESSLLKEHIIVHGDFIVTETKYRLNSLAHTYALTYELIAEFQRQHINVSLCFGSHLGALRHHGVIPFNEKDVDLAVFSTDPDKVKRVIQTALDTPQPHLNLTILEGDYGYQISKSEKFLTYIDVFMYRNIESKNVTCVGRPRPDLNCKEFYRKVHKSRAYLDPLSTHMMSGFHFEQNCLVRSEYQYQLPIFQ